MAFRRTDTIASRAKLFYQQRNRFAASYSPTHRDDSDREDSRADPIPRRPATSGYFRHRFSFSGRSILSAFTRPGNAFGDRRFAIPAGRGVVLGRHFSSGGISEDDATDKAEILTDTSGIVADKAEILTDPSGIVAEKAFEAVSEVAAAAADSYFEAVSEVAAAAADSYYPMAAVQYLIGYVHIYTGLDWWASIALTALLIRSLQLPWVLNKQKSTITENDLNPTVIVEGKAIKKYPYKYFRSTWSDDGPIRIRRRIRVPIISAAIFASFIFAVNNMAEKVPSFKEGGIFWFTDLSTPDSMYIFPVLASLTFWITNKCHSLESTGFNSAAGTIKNVSKASVFAALTIPFTASFPKAVFCYWITSNLFSLANVLAIRDRKDRSTETFFEK